MGYKCNDAIGELSQQYKRGVIGGCGEKTGKIWAEMVIDQIGMNNDKTKSIMDEWKKSL